MESRQSAQAEQQTICTGRIGGSLYSQSRRQSVRAEQEAVYTARAGGSLYGQNRRQSTQPEQEAVCTGRTDERFMQAVQESLCTAEAEH
jgi:hypothetical protein